VFEVKASNNGGGDNVVDDDSTPEYDLPSDISECNGILPNKHLSKEQSNKPMAEKTSISDTSNRLLLFDNEFNQINFSPDYTKTGRILTISTRQLIIMLYIYINTFNKRSFN
jgi:hypothetical protein